ncbi:MAG TPA: UMP kinase [Candidatus Lokiarchaeia archaeon]|nr:UMP kinase [Candidatus Lokiarchaeia archaeon]
MAREKNVLKIGGSLLFDDEMNVKIDSIQEFIEFIVKNVPRLDCVVVGGGKIARAYINAIKDIHPNEAVQDLLGIKVSRLNALAIANLVGPDVAYQGVPESIESLLRLKSELPDKIVFMGGLEVGQSTTSVACEAAEALEAASLVIGTDVDGIYTKNPKEYTDAIKLDEITLAEIATILDLGNATNQQAGEYRILDNVSIGIIARSKFPVRIVKGDVDTFEAAFAGEAVGTLVKP